MISPERERLVLWVLCLAPVWAGLAGMLGAWLTGDPR